MSREDLKNYNREAIPSFKEYFISNNDKNLYFIDEKQKLKVSDANGNTRELTYTELIGLVRMLKVDENSKGMAMLKLAKHQCEDIKKRLVVYIRNVKGEQHPNALRVFILENGKRCGMDIQVSLNRQNPDECFTVCNTNGEVERKATHAEMLGLEEIAKATIKKIEYDDETRTREVRRMALKAFREISVAYDNHVKNNIG